MAFARVLGGACGWVVNSDSECEVAPQHLEFESGSTVDGDSQVSFSTEEPTEVINDCEQGNPYTNQVPFLTRFRSLRLDERHRHRSNSQSSTYLRPSNIASNMADRRRINGPVGTTIPPIYDDAPEKKSEVARATRSRPANVIRKICKRIEETLLGTQSNLAFRSQDGSDTFGLWLCLPRD